MKLSLPTIPKGSSTRIWLSMSIMSGCILMLLELLRWPLVNLLTVFLAPLVEMAAFALFIVVLVGSLVFGLLRIRSGPAYRWLPLGLSLFFALVIYFVPLSDAYMTANFRLLKSRRTKFAESLLAGSERNKENTGGRGNFLTLPPTECILSEDCEIVIDHRGGTFVLFFTFRGILDRFSGYVYSPTDQPPAKDQFLGDGVQIQRIAPNWFWYAS